ncbi:outer membrane beta-barrel protein [Granulicella tundricola]|uniref:outer membrane beta-barrel protein n=1 Tax=Granulicella tundricola TaxID=940615 RepID=UPI0002FE14AC|nr:outer membrane beta-barrel protein [Granulicella tundricola]
MLTRFLAALTLFACSVPMLHAQAKYTAARTGDFQVGVDFAGIHSDYDPKLYKGYGLYTTFDLTNHLGAEFDFNQGSASSPNKDYERTYELGARYFRTYGRYSPYAKIMYGRGVFNFAPLGPVNANLAYNEAVIGAGVDVRVLRYINVRANYEYQDWFGFPANGLNPQVFNVGVAYHFPGGLGRGQHYGK